MKKITIFSLMCAIALVFGCQPKNGPNTRVISDTATVRIIKEHAAAAKNVANATYRLSDTMALRNQLSPENWNMLIGIQKSSFIKGYLDFDSTFFSLLKQEKKLPNTITINFSDFAQNATGPVMIDPSILNMANKLNKMGYETGLQTSEATLVAELDAQSTPAKDR